MTHAESKRSGETEKHLSLVLTTVQYSYSTVQGRQRGAVRGADSATHAAAAAVCRVYPPEHAHHVFSLWVFVFISAAAEKV